MTLDEVFASIDPKWTMEQWPTEIRAFAQWLQRTFKDRTVRRVVELGVRHGGTSALWHQLFPEARVIGVDRIGPDSYQEPEFTARGREMMSAFPRFLFVNGDTGDPVTLERVKVLSDEPVDLLFIDADHSYEGVRRDYIKFGPLVTDGVIAFHDIIDSPRTGGGVAKWWNELQGTKVEFTCGGDWGGIGALRR